MLEQENQKSTHLMLLICSTVFTAGTVLKSVFLGWETAAVVLIVLGLASCWLMHITARIPHHTRLWMYITYMMLVYFFYGIHEDSFFDLAPIMAIFILLFTITEERVFVRFSAIVYCLTVSYDFIFVMGEPLGYPTDMLARIALHVVIVFIAERIAEVVMRRRVMEKTETEKHIRHLEEANRSAEDFLANVSHQLRTPINAVTGITALMLKNEDDPDKRKDLFSIQVAGSRLYDQIADILDYTEIETGRITVVQENYTVPSLINDIIIEQRTLRREGSPELVFDVDAALPSVLSGDGRKIKKIIRHLIDNAVKFTKSGGVYIRVYALRKSYGVNLCINVSDTGIGIAEEELEKIKEKFFQSSGGRDRKAGGLGLGLSIVYGMVTAMEGFIQIESAEGEGTSVSVSIPQQVADPAPSMKVNDRDSLCIGVYL